MRLATFDGVNSTAATRPLDGVTAELAFDEAALRSCIQACVDCAAVSTSARDALADHPAPIGAVLRETADCADLCLATARILIRHAADGSHPVIRASLDACMTACLQLAAACDRLRGSDALRACAASCRQCACACAAVTA
jgi:hypothetical protein